MVLIKLNSEECIIIEMLLATEEFESFSEETIPKGFIKKDYNNLYKKFRKY